MSTLKWDVPTGSNAAAALQPGACQTKCSRSPLPWEVSPSPVLHFSGGCPSRGLFCQGGGFLGGPAAHRLCLVFLLFSVRLGLAVLGCQLVLTGSDDGACGRCAHRGPLAQGRCGLVSSGPVVGVATVCVPCPCAVCHSVVGLRFCGPSPWEWGTGAWLMSLS